jgi:hypothetical protein
MFFARRRPLMRAAMLGGAGYVAGKRRAQAQQADYEQDERISALEQQQMAAPAPPPPAPAATPAPPGTPAAPAASAATGGSALVDRLKELTEMRNSGALSDAEFEQAKRQVLGGA